ncbi:hypothetical protein NT6N_15800 [Oceaniferula spumae]|uniref:Lipoprotein n=1 Tax=Oceaniferula spumae TaxID=2979115 RepID=A0AAT9FKP8_9BACT
MIRLPIFFLLALAFSSCALVTVPVKVAGSVVTTTAKVTGKAVGAGFDAMHKSDEEEAAEAARERAANEGE